MVKLQKMKLIFITYAKEASAFLFFRIGGRKKIKITEQPTPPPKRPSPLCGCPTCLFEGARAHFHCLEEQTTERGGTREQN